MQKPVILTGVRSNADLTLGNLLGAILPLVRLQQKYSQNYQINAFLPDLHSIIGTNDFNDLYERTILTVRTYAAAGLDLKNTNTSIYRQSYVPAHSELAWILDCFIYYGELSRMTQFKEKSEISDSVNVGIFNYPALMAADILLYDASYVPVGEDQRQHLELTRDVAIRMNNQFGDIFTVPKTWAEQMQFNNAGARIRSLKHPEQKMSKSIQDPSGTILLSDNPKDAREKVLASTTDSVGSINYDYINQPGISNLLQIISVIENKPIDDVVSKWRGESSYSKLKQEAADLVEDLLTNFQSSLAGITDQDALSALMAHEQNINQVANAKLKLIQTKVGLRASLND